MLFMNATVISTLSRRRRSAKKSRRHRISTSAKTFVIFTLRRVIENDDLQSRSPRSLCILRGTRGLGCVRRALHFLQAALEGQKSSTGSDFGSRAGIADGWIFLRF